MLTLLLAAALLTEAAPAAAPQAKGAPQAKDRIEAPVAAAGLVAVSKKEKLICRKESVIGTRFPKTVCMSSEDAEARKAMDQDAVRRMQENKVSNVQ